MDNISIAIVALMAVLFLIQIVLFLTKKQPPKWQQVYFYLISVQHTIGSVEWNEVQRVLVMRYKLDSNLAREAIANLHLGELWFIHHIKDEEKSK